MVAHTLQPHLVSVGTKIGVIICEFDARSLPLSHLFCCDQFCLACLKNIIKLIAASSVF